MNKRGLAGIVTTVLLIIIAIALVVIIWYPVQKAINQGEDINKTISELTDLQKLTEDEPQKNYATCDIRIMFQNNYASQDYSAYGVSNKSWSITQSALAPGSNTLPEDFIELYLAETKSDVEAKFQTYLNNNPELSTDTTDLLMIDIEGVTNLGVSPSSFGSFDYDTDLQDNIIKAYMMRIDVVREFFPKAKIGAYNSIHAESTPNNQASLDRLEKQMKGHYRASKLGLYDKVDYLVTNLYTRFGPDDGLNYYTIENFTRAGITNASSITTSSGSPIPIVVLLSVLVYNGNSENDKDLVTFDSSKLIVNTAQEYPQVKIISYWAGSTDTYIETTGVTLAQFFSEVQPSPPDCPKELPNPPQTSELSLYVSPSGEDSNTGTLESPFKTIQKAKDEARARTLEGMSKDLTIYLRGGNYFLDSTLEFTELDSGKNGYKIIYKNYSNEEPIIIGGELVSDWEFYQAGIYKTNVGSGRNINYLSENNKLSKVAQAPNAGYFSPIDNPSNPRTKFEFKPSELQQFDFSSASVYGFPLAAGSNGLIAPIISIDWNTNTITLEENQASRFETGSRYKILNSLDFLDSAGEFYYDKVSGDLYYWPVNSPIENQQIVISDLKKVISFSGSSENSPARDISLQGLTITGGSTLPISYRVITVQRQGRPYEFLLENSAVYFENASDIEVKNSKFIALGGYALLSKDYTQGVRIYGNLIEDVGLGGIGFHGSPYTRNYNNKNNIVSNNYIKDIGVYFGSLSGIHLFFSGDNLISNNEITQVPFNGIELRGMRYDELKITPKLQDKVGDITSAEQLREIIYTKNNLVKNNDISKTLLAGGDNAGIYTSGVVNNILDNNRIHDITPNPSGFAAGIYLDPNSDFTTIKKNIIYNINGVGVPLTFKGINITVENNILANWRNGPNILIIDLMSDYSSLPLDRRIDSPTQDAVIEKNIMINTLTGNGGRIYDLSVGHSTTIPKWNERTSSGGRNLILRSNNNLYYFANGGYQIKVSDYNWDASQSEGGFISLNDWQSQYNLDKNSLVENPSLDGNYNPGNSQALSAIGFQPIDQSNIGLLADFPFQVN